MVRLLVQHGADVTRFELTEHPLETALERMLSDERYILHCILSPEGRSNLQLCNRSCWMGQLSSSSESTASQRHNLMPGVYIQPTFWGLDDVLPEGGENSAQIILIFLVVGFLVQIPYYRISHCAAIVFLYFDTIKGARRS